MSAFFDPSSQPDGDVRRLVRELSIAFERVRMAARATEDELTAAIEAASGTGASTTAEYTLVTADAGLPNARVWVDGTGTTVDTSTAGEISINVAGATITVEAADGSPTYAGITTMRFDEADGFVITNPGGGAVARCDLANVPGSVLANVSVALGKITMSTDRLLGRDTAGSGAPEELIANSPLVIGGDAGAGHFGFEDAPPATFLGNITGADAQPDYSGPANDGEVPIGDNGGEIVWRHLVITDVDRTVYELDFSTLANNTFANGTEVIDGKNWTCFSAAAAGTWALQNGTGIRWIPAVSTAGVFSDATQSAAGIYIDLATLIGPTFHPGKKYSFEVRFGSRTLNASSRVGPALWLPAGTPTGAAARQRTAGVNNSGGTQFAFSQQQGTATNGQVNVAGDDVFSLIVEPGGTSYASSGAWSGGWPALTPTAYTTTQFAVPSFLNHPSTRFVLTHSHNAQNPVVDNVVWQRLRVVEL